MIAPEPEPAPAFAPAEAMADHLSKILGEGASPLERPIVEAPHDDHTIGGADMAMGHDDGLHHAAIPEDVPLPSSFDRYDAINWSAKSRSNRSTERRLRNF